MTARAFALLPLLAALGCSGEEFSSSASGGSAGSGGGNAGGAGGTSAGGSAGTSAGGGGGSGGGGGTSPSGQSCRELQKSGVTQTGIYTVVTQNGVAIPVRCDMDVAGGGWTLIARSADGTLQGNGFGWSNVAGAPDDPSTPYSLGIGVNRIPFNELLLTDRDGSYGVTKAFVGQIPSGFIKTYATTPYAMPAVATVVGSCPPSGGVSMMAHLGYTNETDVYYVRDQPQFEPFGLREDGWVLGESTDCAYNADVNWKHGMLFVR